MIQRIDQIATRQVRERCIDRRSHTSTSRHCHELSSVRKDWHARLATKGTETTEHKHQQTSFVDGVSKLAEARTGNTASNGPHMRIRKLSKVGRQILYVFL